MVPLLFPLRFTWFLLFPDEMVPIYTLQDTMANEPDYVELGPHYAYICEALKCITSEEKWRTSTNPPAGGEWTKNVCRTCDVHFSRFHSPRPELQDSRRNTKEGHRTKRVIQAPLVSPCKLAIVPQKSDLSRLLHVFNVCSARPRFIVATRFPY